MTENMEIWNALGITDRKHTKPFKRAGGFSGDAIKPMYAIQKMTEKFGVCGIGWGFTKPHYTIHDAGENGVLVYCDLSIWFKHNGEKSEPVPGAGGDFVVGKNKYGLNPDDEAFKKAMTDALMNAMKHIGMSADVHMGQFDGSKYSQPEPEAPRPVAKPQEEKMNDEDYNRYRDAIPKAKDLKELQDLFGAAWTLAKGDTPAREGLTKLKDKRKEELTNQGE